MLSHYSKLQPWIPHVKTIDSISNKPLSYVTIYKRRLSTEVANQMYLLKAMDQLQYNQIFRIATQFRI